MDRSVRCLLSIAMGALSATAIVLALLLLDRLAPGPAPTGALRVERTTWALGVDGRTRDGQVLRLPSPGVDFVVRDAAGRLVAHITTGPDGRGCAEGLPLRDGPFTVEEAGVGSQDAAHPREGGCGGAPVTLRFLEAERRAAPP